jgi:hypothetical protein
MRSIVAKPEIGAPGESVSAIAGSGSEEGPFGGTSGATPMVTGSAALLLDAFPHRTPMDLKNSLVNTAETEIFNGPTELGAGLAPIARIGGGEVRVDRAIEAAGAAWDADTRGALSFGLADVTSTETITRQVLVRNFSDSATTYAVTPQFRFDNDAASGAVSVSAPGSVTVPARDQTLFDVTITIDGSALADWSADSGAGGADSGPITDLEYDGYLVMESSKGSLHLPWHVLPRKSGDVEVRKAGKDYSLTNNGVGTQTVEAYSLIASSEDLPEGGRGENSPTPDFRYLGYSTFPVPAGFCSDVDSFVMAFAVNTWERQTHANAPASFWFVLDTDQDGTDDYIVINRDLTFSGLDDGRNVTWSVNLGTGDAEAFFFTDHQTNSANTVLLICGEQVGLNATNFGQPMDVTAIAEDSYFGGPGDEIGGITIAPLGERFLADFAAGEIGLTVLEPGASDTMSVIDTGSDTNNTETGILLLYRGGSRANNEARAIVLAN